MALIVEDGTGLSTSNSYLSQVDADTYHADRGNTTAWGAVTSKDALLIMATDFLRDETIFHWKGVKNTHLQALSWPRTNVIESHGQAVPNNEVPARVKNATAQLALILATQVLHPTITRSSGDVRKEKVDVIETEYFSSKFRTNNPEDYTAIVTSVMGLLSPLLRKTMSDFLEATPYSDLPERNTVVDQPRPLFYDGMNENT